MIALIQRVSHASVSVDDRIVGRIGLGLLAFICAEKEDTEQQSARLLTKLLSCRVFNDPSGKMNLSLTDIRGELLIVSQFTLAADTRSGNRPSFTAAADPITGKRLYDHFISQAKSRHSVVQTGIFGANMQVHLINDGPVTFWLKVS